jgi:hypothetical protein
MALAGGICTGCQKISAHLPFKASRLILLSASPYLSKYRYRYRVPYKITTVDDPDKLDPDPDRLCDQNLIKLSLNHKNLFNST